MSAHVPPTEAELNEWMSKVGAHDGLVVMNDDILYRLIHEIVCLRTLLAEIAKQMPDDLPKLRVRAIAASKGEI